MQRQSDPTAQSFSASAPLRERLGLLTSDLPQEALIAGSIGAVVIALWFLLLDLLAGHPLYTPTVLGEAFFQRSAGPISPDNLPVSIELVFGYSVFHWLAFTIMGGVAAFLLRVVGKESVLTFGVLLVFVGFVVLEFGFRLARAIMLVHDIEPALTWERVLIGNLLAAVAMGVFLLCRHRPAQENHP